jgi:hypothetical protein
MSAVINATAWSDPARASGLVSTLTDPSMRASATQSVVSAWAQRDPRAAFAWIARLPPTEAPPSSYRALFQSWANQDVDEALRYVDQIEDGRSRDSAISGLLGSAYLESDAIDRLYQRIESADGKRQAAMTIYATWRERDPRFAERYLQQAGVRQSPGR